MKKVYYSDLNKSFYVDGVHKSIPQDAIEITKEKHQQILSHLNNGKVVEIVNGKIVLKNKNVIKPTETIKEKRDKKIFSNYNKELEVSTWKKVKENKDGDLTADDLIEVDKKIANAGKNK